MRGSHNAFVQLNHIKSVYFTNYMSNAQLCYLCYYYMSNLGFFFFFFFGRMSNLGFSYYQVLIFYYLCSHKNDFSFMVPSNCYRAYFLLTNGCIKVYFYKRRDRIIGGSHEFQHPKTLCDVNKFYLFD